MLILYCLLLQCSQHVLPSVDTDDPLQLHTSGHMLRLAFAIVLNINPCMAHGIVGSQTAQVVLYITRSFIICS